MRTVDLTPPKQISSRIPEEELLDVGIAVFDPNVPEDYDAALQAVVNPEVREAESTGNWGAVRMIPTQTHAVDVMVTGRILVSQGERLVLAVQARDARGVVWLDRTYQALASKYSYGDDATRQVDPFQQLYTQVADDLAAAFLALTPAERRDIRRTARMRFAEDLLPAAYDGYVEETPSGRVDVTRLPAGNDPMMTRIRRVREREFLFIDTLDGHYAEYERRVRPIYQTWRRVAYAESMARLEIEKKRRHRVMVGTLSIVGGLAGGPAGFSAIPTGAHLLQNSFNDRNEAALHGQALQEISASMESEVAPYTLELENRTVRLTGTVEEQFARLRTILRASYFESLGLEPPETLSSR